MFNVLLSCAGRRNYLVQYFRAALAGRGQVFAADACPQAPALHEADRAFVLPAVSAPDYLDRLLQLCSRENVRMIVTLNDYELPLLARQRERLHAVGTLPVVSSPEVIELCHDKWATFRRLKELGFEVPRTWNALEDALEASRCGVLSFPVVLKPRWGTGSIGVEFLESPEELVWAWRLASKRLARSPLGVFSAAEPERSLLVQERLTGEEHGLDVVNDLEGRPAAVFARRKLAMRSGETDRAVIVEHPGLIQVGRRLGAALRHAGNLDCDVFVDRDGTARVLELNPRFGGGYPFSHAAGADVPAALIAWAGGEPPDPGWLRVRPGASFAKCDRLVPLDGTGPASEAQSRRQPLAEGRVLHKAPRGSVEAGAPGRRPSE